MRLRWNVWALAATLCVPAASRAATCTAQAELSPQDRAALADTGGRLAQAVVQQDTTLLQSALLPAEASDWTNIQGAIDAGSARSQRRADPVA